MKNKIILTGLFLTTAISCSAYRPIVLTDAYLDAVPTTVTYDDLNFNYALFNQFASGLSYTFRLEYSSAGAGFDARALGIFVSGFGYFTNWTTVTTSFSEGECSGACRSAMNQVLFNRQFDPVTKKALQDRIIIFTKYGNDVGVQNDTVNFIIKVKSAISYSVSVGSVYLSQKAFKNANVDQYYILMSFYNDTQLLNNYYLNSNVTNTQIDVSYNLANILTNVNSFDLFFQWVDFPPFASSASQVEVYEFNLFTQNQEIAIPDDVSGDRFGFEFVAVEWWNILGHLQNFAWWIVNKSPIAPVFEWLDTYVLTWINGLITFVTGVFNL